MTLRRFERLAHADSRKCGIRNYLENLISQTSRKHALIQCLVDSSVFEPSDYEYGSGLLQRAPKHTWFSFSPYALEGLTQTDSGMSCSVCSSAASDAIAPWQRLASAVPIQSPTVLYPSTQHGAHQTRHPIPHLNNSAYNAPRYNMYMLAKNHISGFFQLGNPRGNENPFLLTFGILGFRWHNHIARYIKLKNPSWTGEHIFNEARKWVIATQQALIMYDWLPKYIRDQPNVYNGYIPTTNPQIAHIFQSAAMRFGHTMVTQGVHLKNRSADGCDSNGFARTCNSFWRSHEWFKNDTANFERFLMGLSSQSTEKEDSKIVEDLRGSLFGPLEFSRRDLMAINIQRARDHGLPDYNTARRHYGLEPLISLDPAHFKKITNAPDVVPVTEVLEKLKNLYNDNPDKVDVWAGGLLETNKGPGQLFKRVIKDQFERIRDGDRFWFENNKSNMFSAEERQRLKQVKIIDLVLSVTNLIVNEDIQADPFLAVNKKDNE
ncbi:unnamed protein product, partial [Meganyctiphanes norvegica]